MALPVVPAPIGSEAPALAQPAVEAGVVPAASAAAIVQLLPQELLLRFLEPLAPAPAHAAVSAACRTLRKAARDDALWAFRLARDFPLAAAQGKTTRALHCVYRILAKTRPQRPDGGVGAVPASRSMAALVASTFDGAPAADTGAGSQAEIRALAARFHYLNMAAGNLDDVIRPTRQVVFHVGREVPRRGAVAGGDRAALFAELRQRAQFIP